MTRQSAATLDNDTRIPPRGRILAAADELFYRHGIRAVGVEAIAEAAGTNKMTLYRHFASKDELVAEYLRQSANVADGCWDRLARAHPSDPLAQLGAWLKEMAAHLAEPNERGCALANAAVELPEKDHPARRVIEAFKSRGRERIVELCRKAGLHDPELLADELFLLGEGARLSVQSLGPNGPARRLAEMFQTLVAAHTSKET